MKTFKGYVDSFISSYLECALWSSTDEEGNPLDNDYDESYFAQSALDEAKKDCVNFIWMNREYLRDLDPGQSGHDFWLTRNRHGAGFWDRGLGEVGAILTKASHSFGSSDIYVDEDHQLHFQ